MSNTSNFRRSSKTYTHAYTKHRTQLTNDHSRKSIICNETGQTFRSIKTAADHFNIPTSSLSHHLRERKGYEIVHGKTFKFIDE